MSSRDEGAPSGASSAPRRRRSRKHSERGPTRDDAVIAWVGILRRKGWHRTEIQAAADAGEHGWPGDGKGLSDGQAQVIYGILADRDRTGERAGERARTSSSKRGTEGGKRLRQLHDDKRAGVRDPEAIVFKLQVALGEAVSELERYDLPELEWTEEIDRALNEIVHEIERHRTWNDRAWDVTWSHMDDVGRQRKLRTLRDRANDPSSESFERRSASNLADKLEEKYRQQRGLGA